LHNKTTSGGGVIIDGAGQKHQSVILIDDVSNFMTYFCVLQNTEYFSSIIIIMLIVRPSGR